MMKTLLCATAAAAITTTTAHNNNIDKQFEVFVTSSGTTDGFETYDFDYFTDAIAIAGIFNTEQLTISISEVRKKAI